MIIKELIKREIEERELDVNFDKLSRGFQNGLFNAKTTNFIKIRLVFEDELFRIIATDKKCEVWANIKYNGVEVAGGVDEIEEEELIDDIVMVFDQTEER